MIRIAIDKKCQEDVALSISDEAETRLLDLDKLLYVWYLKDAHIETHNGSKAC